MIQPSSLKSRFFDAVFSMVVKFPVGVLLLIYVLPSIKLGRPITIREYWEILVRYWTSPDTWRYWAIMWPLVFLALVFYPYFRERNPQYIKKMKAYEKMKEEKEAAKSKETSQ